MCGICGLTKADRKRIDSMVKNIEHRGPDARDIFIDKNVAIGHTRLAIIDLSPLGKQPMEYTHKGKTIHIVFNGEIYNYQEIKEELVNLGYKFKSSSDTEVILASYHEFGKKCVEKFNGMWAFAIYDKSNNELFCSRDRLGIKPFYYKFHDEIFEFASEMRCLNTDKKVDDNSLIDFFRYRCILQERTLWQDIRKLEPGHNLTFNLDEKKIQIDQYWKIKKQSPSRSRSYGQIKDELKTILEESVRYRLIADVPVQVSLSGGLDSSLITAIASKLKKDITAYTVGFNMPGDEVDEAKQTAKYLNIRHKTVNLDVKEMVSDVDNIINSLEDPVADPAIFPANYIYKEAVKDAKVLLLGEGSDELFGGYFEYKLFDKNLPFNLKAFNYLRNPYKYKNPLSVNGKKIKYSKNLNHNLMTDVTNILPNFQLLRVDKLSMAHGLEARVPFLDHNVVESAFRMHSKYKINKFQGKFILRDIAKDYLDSKTLNRNKKTFFSPLDFLEGKMLKDAQVFIEIKRLKHILNYEYFMKLIKNYKKYSGVKKNRKRYELFIWWQIEKIVNAQT